MANHNSALKRIRSDIAKRTRNRYQHKTIRNAIRALRNSTNKKEIEKKIPEVFSMIDKLAKKKHIHKNKAANLKSRIALHTQRIT